MRKTFQLVLGGAALVLATQNALAADWFGLPLPTGLSDPDQPVLIIGTDFRAASRGVSARSST